MKKIMIIFAALFLSAAIVSADNRAIDASKLPAAAKAYMEKSFPGEQILYATQEDDLFLPDYDVALANGVLLEFYNNGSLEKIACRTGISLDLIPVPIIEFVKVRYPDAFFVEYKVDKREFEVTLSNRMELKFNKNYNLIGIDD
jgi:hypothetical protein